MDIIALSTSDIEAMWDINEQGLPGTGKVSKEEIAKLLEFSSLSVGAYDQGELLGFVVPESLGPAVPLSMDVPASMIGAEASMIGAEASIVMPESLGADASFWTTVPESVDPASIRAG